MWALSHRNLCTWMSRATKTPLKSLLSWTSLGGPVVKTLRTCCRGHGFDPWSWAVWHAVLCSQKQCLLSFARTFGDLAALGWCRNSPGVSAPPLPCGTPPHTAATRDESGPLLTRARSEVTSAESLLDAHGMSFEVTSVVWVPEAARPPGSSGSGLKTLWGLGCACSVVAAPWLEGCALRTPSIPPWQ